MTDQQQTRSSDEVFSEIYDTDLTYIRDCYKLCGDAHCCTRQSKFTLLHKDKEVRLPLLPGEHQFLVDRGWNNNFSGAMRETSHLYFDHRAITVDEFVVPDSVCICTHNTRLTTCRLYPVLPLFNTQGQLASSTTEYGIYDVMETIDGSERRCKVNDIPSEQMSLFLQLASALASNPTILFHLIAYRLALTQVRNRTADIKQQHPTKSGWTIYQSLLLRNQAVDGAALRAQLSELADSFETRYGNDFTLPTA